MKNLKNKKIAIYGGSFNPIHVGHILTGLEIIEKLKYDYIIYVPDNIPVHKDSSDFASSLDRLNMVKLAVQGFDNFIISDVEIKRGGLSFTYDTVLEIKKIYNYDEKIGLIFGDDLLDGLSSWKNIELLDKICDLICLNRNKNVKISSKYKINYFKNRVLEISSSEIRMRIKNNLPIDFMVSENVKNYILEKNLYGAKNGKV